MELKLVYRCLRTLSDWILEGYYSEVVVEGAENVSEEGPLIVASTHSNDMLDIATLSVTIPHRTSRFLCFWAKSDMFANPVAGTILRSSGAIPVRRNPNKASSRSGGSGSSPPPSKAMASSTAIATGTGTSTVKATATTPGSGVPTNRDTNGNGSNDAPSPTTQSRTTARTALFASTTHVLARRGVVGLFPEGGSYTGWRVFQVMPGAAWCGVEHARAVRGCLEGEWDTKDGMAKAKNVVIVPTAITYTDKAKYLSRVHVKYGTPIALESYLDELFDEEKDPDVAATAIVKKITAELERRLVGMTVNADDWETVCAVATARQILWTDEDRIRLQDWVEISQRLAKALDASPAIKAALTRYNALLYHTGIKHAILESIWPSLPPSSSQSTSHPPPSTTSTQTLPTTLQTATSLLLHLPLAFPRLALFLPPLVLFVPGYVAGPLLARAVADPREEEAQAQFKAVGAGLGMGLGVLGWMFGARWIWGTRCWTGFNGLERLVEGGSRFVAERFGFGERFTFGFLGGRLGDTLAKIGLAYLAFVALIKWHNMLVKANYRDLQTLLTHLKLLLASLSPAPPLTPEALAPYTEPIYPTLNPWITPKCRPTESEGKGKGNGKDGGTAVDGAFERAVAKSAEALPRGVGVGRLLRPLVEARAEARRVLGEGLFGERKEDGREELRTFLRERGAVIP